MNTPPSGTSMSNTNAHETSVRNKANYLKAKEAFNDRDIERCVAFYAPEHQIRSRPSPQGRQAIRAFFENTHKDWPGIRIVVEHVVAEADWVMGRSVATATHSTAVFGVEPTHKEIETTFWDLHRFDREGLIVESWNLMDSLTVMGALGLIRSGPK